MARQSAKNIQEGIILDLGSNDDAKILAALDKIPTHGSAAIIEPLLECYDETTNDDIKAKIKALLSELKDTTTVEPMVDYFRLASSETKEMILNAFWNNNLSPFEYLDVFVESAIQGSYMECFELLTLIENMDADYSEMEFKHMIADLEDAVENEELTMKSEILTQLLDIIKQLNPKPIANDKV